MDQTQYGQLSERARTATLSRFFPTLLAAQRRIRSNGDEPFSICQRMVHRLSDEAGGAQPEQFPFHPSQINVVGERTVEGYSHGY